MKNRLSQQLLVLCVTGASLATGVWSGSAAAAGDAAAGAQKSIFCAYCHGSDGNPLDNAAPRLAGQDADILVAKMKYQTKVMGRHEMMIQAFRTGRALNDKDMADLAAYFSSQAVRQTAHSGRP